MKKLFLFLGKSALLTSIACAFSFTALEAATAQSNITAVHFKQDEDAGQKGISFDVLKEDKQMGCPCSKKKRKNK